jgi:DnaJ-class molecular chaperone
MCLVCTDSIVILQNASDTHLFCREKVVPGEGMPISKKGATSRGDLRIKFDIVFPRQLTTQQQTGLRQYLPAS